ncbi:MAG: hypothetical protein R3A10_09345 [Caldilineaceae bacterium]
MPLAMDAAQLFTQTYYDDLARSGRVDMALAATRLTLSQHTRMPPGTWGVPVLYMNSSDGELLDWTGTPTAQVPRPPADIRTLAQMGATEDPRVRALGNLFAQQAQALGAASVVGPLQQAIQSGDREDCRPGGGATGAGCVERGALPLNARLDAAALADHIARVAKLELPAGLVDEIACAQHGAKSTSSCWGRRAQARPRWPAICDYAATADVPQQNRDHGHGRLVDLRHGRRLRVPTADQGNIAFQPGNFLHAITCRRVAGHRRINRAEIDKAFGELFTVLGQRMDTPYRVGGARPHPAAGPEGTTRLDPPASARTQLRLCRPPPLARIIGTMNVYDTPRSTPCRWPSCAASYRPGAARRIRATARRLGAVIPVSPRWAAAVQDELLALLTDLLGSDSQLMTRALGPAIARDMIAYVGERVTAKRPWATCWPTRSCSSRCPSWTVWTRRDPGHSRRAGPRFGGAPRRAASTADRRALPVLHRLRRGA